MTGLFLSAWLLFPLLLAAASVGCGLLVRRLSDGALSGVLLMPVGFALVVSLCTLGTSNTWFAPTAGIAVVVIAALGFLVERRALPIPRRVSASPLFPALAALAGFAVVAAPVVLTWTPTWTGFGRIVDTAFQMAFSQHLAEAGRSVPVGDSSFNETILGLTGNGYPGGAQATLGAMAGVVRTDVAWCYQAYLAFAAAMGALALFALLRRVVANPLFCCIGAAIAIQPNILYAYALVGGIKELTTASLVLLVAAFVAEWLDERPRSLRSAVGLAPPLAGALAAFSYGALPWAGLVLLAAFALSLFQRGRLRTLTQWAIAVAGAAILAIPTVISSIKLYGTAKEAVQGVVEVGLGNLTAPIPEISAVGVWISNDYRFPQFAHQSVSHTFDLAILVLGAIGIVAALWRRRWIVAAFGASAPIALTYVVTHAGPWVELKAFTITATMFLAMAFVGAGWLATARPRRLRLRLPIRVAGWLAALAIAGAVLYGNALTYHDTSLAPAARYHQLEQIGKRFAGVRPAFFPAFDEYSELFLRREHGYDLVRPPGLRVRPGAVALAPGQFAYSLDMNQFELSFVEAFPLLIVSRSAVATRPPVNFELVDRTPDFEVWRRVRPGSEVVVHYPLSGTPTERDSNFCRGLARSVRRAGAGASVAYVPVGPQAALVPTQVAHPSYWHPLGPEALRAVGAGTIHGKLSLPARGRYEIWMPGSVGRPLTLYVDGRRVGSVAYQFRYPGQFLKFASAVLGAGTHDIRLVRGNGSLHPGSGDGPDTASGVVGELQFSLRQAGDGRVAVVPGAAAERVCRAAVGYEWIEVLRPGAPAAG
jgi:hypothetical protein